MTFLNPFPKGICSLLLHHGRKASYTFKENIFLVGESHKQNVSTHQNVGYRSPKAVLRDRPVAPSFSSETICFTTMLSQTVPCPCASVTWHDSLCANKRTGGRDYKSI